MMKAEATKEQMISYGYTEKEIEKAEKVLHVNVWPNLCNNNWEV